MLRDYQGRSVIVAPQTAKLKATRSSQGEQADAVLADGDTDDAGSGWETASDAEDEEEGADGAQPMATTEAGNGAEGAQLVCAACRAVLHAFLAQRGTPCA